MSLFKKKGKEPDMPKNSKVQSILSKEELTTLNPEGIEINTVIDDITSQDLVNEDDIMSLSEGDAENVTEAEGE